MWRLSWLISNNCLKHFSPWILKHMIASWIDHLQPLPTCGIKGRPKSLSTLSARHLSHAGSTFHRPPQWNLHRNRLTTSVFRRFQKIRRIFMFSHVFTRNVLQFSAASNDLFRPSYRRNLWRDDHGKWSRGRHYKQSVSQHAACNIRVVWHWETWMYMYIYIFTVYI